MSMAKQETIRAIGERTRMRSHDVQRVVEALFEVWFEELAQGGKIEIEHFMVLEVKTIHRNLRTGSDILISNGQKVYIPSTHRELKVRPSKRLRSLLNPRFDP